MAAPADASKSTVAVTGGGMPISTPPLLQRYRRIAAASRRLLAAVQARNDSEVTRWQGQCRLRIKALTAAMRGGGAGALSDADDQVRMELLRGILSDDAAIRALVDPGTAWIDHLLSMPAAMADTVVPPPGDSATDLA